MRFLRRAIAGCSAVSLAACLAVGVLWVRSHFVFDQIAWYRETRGQRFELYGRSELYSCGGGVRLGFGWGSTTGDADVLRRIRDRSAASGNVIPEGLRWDREEASGYPSFPPDGTRVGGFYWEGGPPLDATVNGPPEQRPTHFYSRNFTVVFPYWSAFAVPALFGAPAGLRKWRRFGPSSRRKPGHCVRCGYDLRGTPDRCPECGTAGR